MLVVLESTILPMLSRGIDQLNEDFIKVCPGSIVVDSKISKGFVYQKELSVIPDDRVALVSLREPYALIDCMNSNSKVSKEFVYQVMDYLHNESHHLAISLTELRIMNRRLRILVGARIRLRSTFYHIIHLSDGRRARGILGGDNMWNLITMSPESLLPENIEEDQDMSNKILVTLESEGRRKDYLVVDGESFTTEDGTVLTVVLPDNPGIIY